MPAGPHAPAKTPGVIFNRLHLEVVRVPPQTGSRNKPPAAGVEPIGGSPREFADLIRTEAGRIGKDMANNGIRDP